MVKVEVLQAAKEDKAKDKEADKEVKDKSGTAVGTLTAKGKDFVEVKADGEEKARRYVLHFGGTKELLQAIKDTEVGSRVRVLPNHVCMTAAMYDRYYVTDGGVEVVDQWDRVNGW